MTSAPSREGLGLPLHLLGGAGGNGFELAAGNGAGSSVPTLTTPTLTPTTLRNIEQMFMDSDPCLDNGSSSHHANAARFEPPPISLGDLIKVESVASAEESPPAVVPIPSWIADGSVLPGPHSNAEPLPTVTAPPSLPPSTLIIPNPSSSLVASSSSTSLSSSSSISTSTVVSNSLPSSTAAAAAPIVLPTVPLPVILQQPQPPAVIAATVAAPPASSVPASIVVTTHNNNNNNASTSNGNPPPPPPLTLTMPPTILPSLPPASVLNSTLALPLSTQPLLNDVSKLSLPTEPVAKPPVATAAAAVVSVAPATANGSPKAVVPTAPRTGMDEATRKALRRQRNKEAAARCRQRRLDKTETLQVEVDRWEAKNADTQAEIRSLEEKKRELEELLKAHRTECKVAVRKVLMKSEGVS